MLKSNSSKKKFQAERSKASIRLEIEKAMKLQDIPITYLVVDKYSPLPSSDYNDNWSTH